MSAFEDAARRILEGTVANAYGVDEVGPIYFTDWHYNVGQRGDGIYSEPRLKKNDRLSDAFAILCAGEILVP